MMVLIESGALAKRAESALTPRVHKRVDTCGFHPLENHPFPLDSLVQTRDRRPLRNKGNGSRGYRCVAFSAFSQFTDNVLLHIRAIYLVPLLRKAADLCSSTVSDFANTQIHGAQGASMRKKKPLPFPIFEAVADLRSAPD